MGQLICSHKQRNFSHEAPPSDSHCYFYGSKEMLGNPLPENDVHFHVNMPGAGKSYPLKSNENKKKTGNDYGLTVHGNVEDSDITGNGNMHVGGRIMDRRRRTRWG